MHTYGLVYVCATWSSLPFNRWRLRSHMCGLTCFARRSGRATKCHLHNFCRRVKSPQNTRIPTKYPNTHKLWPYKAVTSTRLQVGTLRSIAVGTRCSRNALQCLKNSTIQLLISKVFPLPHLSKRNVLSSNVLRSNVLCSNFFFLWVGKCKNELART